MPICQSPTVRRGCVGRTEAVRRPIDMRADTLEAHPQTRAEENTSDSATFGGGPRFASQAAKADAAQRRRMQRYPPGSVPGCIRRELDIERGRHDGAAGGGISGSRDVSSGSAYGTSDPAITPKRATHPWRPLSVTGAVTWALLGTDGSQSISITDIDCDIHKGWNSQIALAPETTQPRGSSRPQS